MRIVQDKIRIQDESKIIKGHHITLDLFISFLESEGHGHREIIQNGEIYKLDIGVDEALISINTRTSYDNIPSVNYYFTSGYKDDQAFIERFHRHFSVTKEVEVVRERQEKNITPVVMQIEESQVFLRE